MRKIFAYQFNIERYRRDTGDLTFMQHGAYRTLLDEFYLTGGLLPNHLSSLFRITKAISKPERSAVKIILEKFFVDRGDGYLTQKHAVSELQRISKVSQENSEKAIRKNNKNKDLRELPAQPRFSKPVTSNQLNNPNGLFGEQPKEERHGKRRSKPTSFITEDFRPDIKSIGIASDSGIDLDIEQRKFIDYYLAKGESRADWQASFRTWLGNAKRFSAERASNRDNGRREPQDIVGAALRVADRHAGKG